MAFFFNGDGENSSYGSDALGGTVADFDKNAYTLNLGALKEKIGAQFEGLLNSVNPLLEQISSICLEYFIYNVILFNFS